MKVFTLNSLYEIDGCCVRRLVGVDDPTPRQGQDGEWKEAEAIGPVMVGCPMIIVWNVDPQTKVGRCTTTSVVVSIEDPE